MNLKKCIGILTLFFVLVSMAGPAMAGEDEEYQKMQDYLNGTPNHEGVSVIAATDEDTHETVSDDNEEDDENTIGPDEIFSEDKVLGQDVKEGHFRDFLNVKRWVSLLFVNDYITAIVALAFAIMGIVMILLSCGSVLKNGISAAGAMLSIDRDAEEKLETVHTSERGTLAVIRGLGVTFLGISVIGFMITFLSAS